MSKTNGNHSKSWIKLHNHSAKNNLTHLGPLVLTWFSLEWLSNYTHHNVWGEITYPSPNFNVCTKSLYMIILTSEPIGHYNDVIMGAAASQSTSLKIVCPTVDSDADQRKHQSSASLALVRGIHRSQVNSPHKWPVTRKMFPFDDVIMSRRLFVVTSGFAHQPVRLPLNEWGKPWEWKERGENHGVWSFSFPSRRK